MAGVFAFPALLPTFVAEWELSKTEAGWIAGLYFVGYALVAPPGHWRCTDRIDARLVLLAGHSDNGIRRRRLRAAGRGILVGAGCSGCWPARPRRHLPAGGARAGRPLSGHTTCRGPSPSTPPASAWGRRCRSSSPARRLRRSAGAQRSPPPRAGGAARCRRAAAAVAGDAGTAARRRPRCSTSARCSSTAGHSPSCWATACTAGSCSRCAPGWWRSWSSASRCRWRQRWRSRLVADDDRDH